MDSESELDGSASRVWRDSASPSGKTVAAILMGVLPAGTAKSGANDEAKGKSTSRIARIVLCEEVDRIFDGQISTI